MKRFSVKYLMASLTVNWIVSGLVSAADDPYVKIINAQKNGQYPEALDIEQQPNIKQQSQFALLNTVHHSLVSIPPGINPLKVAAGVVVHTAKAQLIAADVEKAKAQAAKSTNVSNLIAKVDVDSTGSLNSTGSKKAQPTATQTPQVKLPPSQPSQADMVEKMIDGWSKAWSQRKITEYFAYYHQDFVPPNPLSRKLWELSRSKRLVKPKYIRIDIIGMTIKEHADKTVTAMFEQHYTSNTYSDIVVKQLTLKKANGKWLIAAEESL
jgi:hypothetical protein